MNKFTEIAESFQREYNNLYHIALLRAIKDLHDIAQMWLDASIGGYLYEIHIIENLLLFEKRLEMLRTRAGELGVEV